MGMGSYSGLVFFGVVSAIEHSVHRLGELPGGYSEKDASFEVVYNERALFGAECGVIVCDSGDCDLDGVHGEPAVFFLGELVIGSESFLSVRALGESEHLDT